MNSHSLAKVAAIGTWTSRQLAWRAAFVGMLLVAPSLWVGLQADDWSVRAAVRGETMVKGVPANVWQPFLIDGDREHYDHMIRVGWLPWWTDLGVRVVHLRTLTLLTHMFDFRILDGWPVLMHVHSIAWYGALCALVAVLFRRIQANSLPWVVGLSALLFAIDDLHGLPAGWLANRNALTTCVFGVGCVLCFDRQCRRGGWTMWMLSPLLLFLALLSKEEGLATCGYLGAYSLWIDQRSWRRRLLSLAPCIVISCCWAMAYQSMGFGVIGGAGYIDPYRSPAGFLAALVDRFPVLMTGLWAFPSADLYPAWSASAFRICWLWSVGVVACVGLLLFPILRQSRSARFFATGMLLSIVPSCGVFSGDRLLTFASIGAAGLIAEWLSWARLRLGRQNKRTAITLVVWLLVAIHLVISPLLLPARAISMGVVGTMMSEIYETLPLDEEAADQTLVFVNTGNQLADRTWLLKRKAQGQAVPRRVLCLNAAASGATLTRIDRHSFLIRPDGGFCRPFRWLPAQEQPAPALSPRYLFHLLDTLVRAPEYSFEKGYRVQHDDAEFEVTGLTVDRRAAEIKVTFRRPPEDDSLRWIQLSEGKFQLWSLPKAGETVRIDRPFG